VAGYPRLIGANEQGTLEQLRTIRTELVDSAIASHNGRLVNRCLVYADRGARLLQSRIEEATLWLEKARSANPVHSMIHAHLASTYAFKGETERAATELAEARRLSGDDRYTSIARLKTLGTFGAVVPNITQTVRGIVPRSWLLYAPPFAVKSAVYFR
jgi:hypothetical protein